jgi:CheY-like chemotaxis protein
MVSQALRRCLSIAKDQHRNRAGRNKDQAELTLSQSARGKSVSVSPNSVSISNTASCLKAGGSMGALMRSMEWAKTLLGPFESWSPLRALLNPRFQTAQRDRVVVEPYAKERRPSKLSGDRSLNLLPRQAEETSVPDNDLVLIVDDDDMARHCLVRLIEAKGYRVEAYSSAEEFLVAESRVHPICLLLDATLPGMSGLDLQRRLGDKDLCPPIIFMSAQDEPSIREKALRGGAIAFLLKPFNDVVLLNAVRSVARSPGDGMSSNDQARPFAEAQKY